MAARARITGLLIACLGAALVVWLLADLGADDVAPALPGAGAPHAVQERAGPALAATGRAGPSGGLHAEGGLAGRVLRDGRPVEAEVAAYRLAEVPWGAPSGGADPSKWRNGARPVAAMEPAAVTRTGPDGSFAVADLPGGHYRLVATDGARTGTCRRVFVAGAARRTQVELRLLPSGGTLEGVVRYESGAPWQGRVLATPTWDRRWFEGPLPSDPPGRRTDEAGRFVLDDLPYGPLRLQALGDDGTRVLAPRVWVPHERTVTLVVRGPDTWMDVRVIAADGGRAIPGATVLAIGYSRHPAPNVFLATRTDPEGRAQVPTGTDNVWLRVEAPGWAKADLEVEKGTRESVVRLSRVATVRGRVVDRDGKTPVQGLAVTLGSDAHAITDADGRFELLDAPAGDRELTCAGQGWLPFALAGLAGGGWPVTVVPATTTSVELEAWRGFAMRGVVRGADGAPLPAAAVTIHRREDDDTWEAIEGTAVVASDGTFRVEGLVADRAYVASAAAPGHAAAWSDTWRLPADGSETEPVVLVLRSPRRLDVHVTDDAGASLRGVRIAVRGREPHWTYVPTDDEGWARIGGLSRDRLRLWARCGGYAVYDQHVEAVDDAGDEPQVVEIALGPAGGITGRVTWRDDTPAVGLEVVLLPGERKDETESDGTFRFEFVPEGEYQVRVAHGNDETAIEASARVVAGTSGLVLRLDAPPPGAPELVEVTVVDGHGLPVAAAELQRFAQEEGWDDIRVVAGRAQVEPGWARLRVHAARGADGVPLPLGPAEVGAREGTQPITLVMPAGVVLRGFVRTEDGGTLAGVKLTVEGRSVYSDAEGRFEVGGLGDEDTSVRVEPPAGWLRRVEVVRPVGGARDVIVRRAAAVLLTVLDPSGEPQPEARVGWQRTDDGARDDMDERGSDVTDANGRLQPARLDPQGRYALLVEPPREDLQCLPVRLEHWIPANATVSLRRGLRVDGVVVDARGRPVAGASVSASRSGEHVDSAWTDAAGRFAFARLEPGALRLRPRADSGSMVVGFWEAEDPVVRERLGEATDVEAGTQGVRLVLDVAPPLAFVVEDWAEVRGVLDEDEDVRAHLRQDASVEPDFPWASTIDRQGRGGFLNPDPSERYTIFVGGLPGGRYVLAKGLVGRDAPYRLQPVRGGVLRGIVHADPGVGDLRVTVEYGGVYLHADVHEGGAFEVRGLPPGETLGVSAEGEVEDRGVVRDVRADAKARVGEAVALHLRADGN